MRTTARRSRGFGDAHPAPFDSTAPLEEQPHCEGVQTMLHLEYAFRQALRVVVIANRDGLLEEDGTTVEALVHEVHCGACNLRPVNQRLPLRVKPRECREERGVDVQHTCRELRDEDGGKTAHESRQ